ncbi:hypothetical protein SVI_0644 [Shewanella violacea DSS12]|uniref:Uncharacterized protein n=1 Tax=Shewanella violacea (strain JCM 10179 / CIP 106290 / LMG 19151 / DSS12) TaxID=637905 RepID=D4ZG16_SHEVD|nr:hypothetical protein SVI_0644 [Shewanella violacea DSS12]
MLCCELSASGSEYSERRSQDHRKIEYPVVLASNSGGTLAATLVFL